MYILPQTVPLPHATREGTGIGRTIGNGYVSKVVLMASKPLVVVFDDLKHLQRRCRVYTSQVYASYTSVSCMVQGQVVLIAMLWYVQELCCDATEFKFTLSGQRRNA